MLPTHLTAKMLQTAPLHVYTLSTCSTPLYYFSFYYFSLFSVPYIHIPHLIRLYDLPILFMPFLVYQRSLASSSTTE